MMVLCVHCRDYVHFVGCRRYWRVLVRGTGGYVGVVVGRERLVKGDGIAGVGDR